MKLKKAIEVQTAYTEGHGVDQHELIDAIKLGIEAMKVVQKDRQTSIYRKFNRLPGETK